MCIGGGVRWMGWWLYFRHAHVKVALYCSVTDSQSKSDLSWWDAFLGLCPGCVEISCIFVCFQKHEISKKEKKEKDREKEKGNGCEEQKWIMKQISIDKKQETIILISYLVYDTGSPMYGTHMIMIELM